MRRVFHHKEEPEKKPLLHSVISHFIRANPIG